MVACFLAEAQKEDGARRPRRNAPQLPHHAPTTREESPLATDATASSPDASRELSRGARHHDDWNAPGRSRRNTRGVNVERPDTPPSVVLTSLELLHAAAEKLACERDRCREGIEKVRCDAMRVRHEEPACIRTSVREIAAPEWAWSRTTTCRVSSISIPLPCARTTLTDLRAEAARHARASPAAQRPRSHDFLEARRLGVSFSVDAAGTPPLGSRGYRRRRGRTPSRDGNRGRSSIWRRPRNGELERRAGAPRRDNANITPRAAHGREYRGHADAPSRSVGSPLGGGHSVQEEKLRLLAVRQ
jgi:hypothetical protein